MKPVKGNTTLATKVLNELFGEGPSRRIAELITKGGNVMENLNKEAAEYWAKQLIDKGLTVEIVEAAERDIERYQVELIDAGKSIIAVIKLIREILKVGLKEAKGIVDRLGVIGIYDNHKEAVHIKDKLEKVGAKIEITVIGAKKPNPKDPSPSPTDPVEPEPEPTKDHEHLIVYGKVQIMSKESPVGIIVQAFDKDLRSEELLGEETLDGKGSYSIKYSAEQFKNKEKGTADIIVRAYNSTGVLLAESEIHFNVTSEHQINLYIPEATTISPSKYELLLVDLFPLLGELSLSELNNEDIWFLSKESENPIDEIAYLIEDNHLASRTGIPKSVYYALALLGIGVVKPDEKSNTNSKYPSLPSLDLSLILEHKTSSLIGHLNKALSDNLIPSSIKSQLHEIEEKFNTLNQARNKEVHEKNKKQYNKLFSDIGIKKETATLISDYLSNKQVYAGTFEDIVKEGIATEKEAKTIRLVYEVDEFTQNNNSLTKVLLNNSSSQLKGKLESIRDLAVFNKKDWEEIITKESIEIPNGKSKEDYASELTKQVETKFPTAVFKNSLLNYSTEYISRVVKTDLTSREAISFKNTYKHMGVDEVLRNVDLKENDKVRVLEKRVSSIDLFLSNNPDLELKTHDFLNLEQTDNKTSYAGIDKDIQPLVKQQMMAYQRVMVVASDIKTSELLLNTGYDSAHAIAADSINMIASKTGLSLKNANNIKHKSQDVKMRSVIKQRLWLDASSMNRTSFDAVPSSERIDYLIKNNDELKNIIGAGSYCSCKHCASILSPAAYFVDLMAFIERHIENDLMGSSSSSLPNLRRRRSDLWDLELSCENSNNMIPYLEIINNTLEKFIAGDVYKKLSTSAQSFHQPFNLPLEQLQLYLDYYKVNLLHITKHNIGWGRRTAQITLGLLPQVWNMITSSNMTDASVLKLYGMKVIANSFDVQEFIKIIGVKRDQLDSLINLKSIAKGNTKIVLKEDADGMVYEEIINLTTPVLRRIYLFMKIWNNLPWKMEALDYILIHFAEKYMLHNAQEEGKSEALLFIAKLRDIQKRMGDISIEMVISLVGNIPNEQTSTSNLSYFDILFNKRMDVHADVNQWTVDEDPEKKISPTTKLSYKALFAVDGYEGNAEETAILDRVLSAMSLGKTEFKELFINLFPSLNDDDTLLLTHQNISMIYRHVLLAKRFNMSIYELFSALKWIQNKQGATIESLADLDSFFYFIDWQKESKVTVQNIDSVLKFYANKVESIETVNDLEYLRATFNLNSKTIQFIVNHLSLFNIEVDKKTSLDNLRLIFSYINLKEAFDKKNELLATYLTADSIDIDILVLLLDNSKEHIQTFIKTIPSDILSDNGEGNRIDILNYLFKSHTLGVKLGIDGKTLKLLSTEEPDELDLVQSLLFNSIRSMHKDEDEFKLRMEPYINKLMNSRRDALVDYLLHLPVDNPFKKYFSTKSDLYYYFLLDTELEACASSSLIVAATNSIQLYLHRCFMGLEEGINPTAEMIEEWPWRKNYRVWEANRKVFLYPENYLEPDLRDNKTPAFLELEKSLLQQDINEDTVEAAYTDYLKEFTTVANLKIIGSCYDKDTKTTHLFGRNPSEPERIFHREMRKIGYKLKLSIVSEPEYTTEWTPWKELSIKMNAKYISPFIIEGRLHVFWVESTPRIETRIKGDDIKSIPYSDFKLKLSRSNLDGTLGQPIEIDLKDSLVTRGDFHLDLKVYPFVDGKNLYITRRPHGSHSLGGIRRNDDPSFAPPRITEKFEKGDTFKVDLFSKNVKTVENYSKDKRPILLTRGFDKIDHKDFSNSGNMKVSILKNNFNYYDYEADVISYAIIVKDDSSTTMELFDSAPIGPVQAVLHSPGSYFIESDEQSFLLDINFALLFIIPLPFYKLINLSTPIAKKLFSKFLNNGIDEFLTRDTQQMSQTELPFIIKNDSLLRYQRLSENQLDFSGAYGLYYQELFLHIPLLIANHLNANQHFEQAQRWYHYVFNPISSNLPPSKESISNGEPAKSHLWNYIEFLKSETIRMKEVLVDDAALEKYKSDPFNPHAIARLRLSAYQRSVAMKYIDNLLDWGDHLFSQDSRESINEATLLYIMAADILGDRPVELGSCDVTGIENKKPMTYSQIKVDNEFLPVFENMEVPSVEVDEMTTDKGLAASSILPEFQQAFCIPDNKDMLAYWNRVEDRLFKIRNCMNISGVRRELALFAPPIDPALLVKAKAAGLSIEDALALSSPSLPNYRFIYLLEKAKSFTSSVQSFGSALLSALASKDAEELTLIRSTHHKNILNLGSQLRNQQIETAEKNLEALKLSLEAAEYRKEYYGNLITDGLSTDEEKSLDFMKSANSLNERANAMKTLAAFAQLAPDFGSPLAFLYGGKHIGQSLSMHATATDMIATGYRNRSGVSSIKGNYYRREQGWEHQKELSKQEIAQLEKQIIGAEIRLDISKRELEIHEESIAHGEELYDFYKDKFTNSGLFNWLASELNTLHRTVYNMAHDLANQAQKAYNFERDGQIMTFINAGHWDSQKAGLLAGERLHLQLRQMEKEFIETNQRKQEIDQTFSLTQISPKALLDLKRTGECDFNVTELFFDLFYPGQFRRKIKSVRLTIPSVTGPYTNISAVLSLTKSYIRMDTQESSELIALPNTLFPTISTSTAQNDAGVFELNFNGEKYMPFEGAGAISEWNLSLPKTFRQFDYNTINDVIIHISYTADYDGRYRDRVEGVQADTESEILNYLTQESNSLSRTFSLRQEFSTDFHRLSAQEKNTAISLKIQEKHFPFFLHDKNIKVKTAKIILVTPNNQTADDLEMKVNNEAVTEFERDVAFGNLYTADLNIGFANYIIGEHIITIVEGGDLAPETTMGNVEALDTAKLEDIILYVEYYLI